jgi:hypothetical protein
MTKKERIRIDIPLTKRYILRLVKGSEIVTLQSKTDYAEALLLNKTQFIELASAMNYIIGQGWLQVEEAEEKEG